MSHYFLRHRTLLALCVVTILGLAVYLPEERFLTLILTKFEQIRHWNAVGLCLLYIPASVLFVPVFIISLASGFLLNFPQALFVITTGNVVGAATSFVLSRTVLQEYIEIKLANNTKYQVLDSAVAERGFLVVFVSRIVPFLSYNLLNYMYGISRVRRRDFILGTYLGMWPSAVVLTVLGRSAHGIPEIIENPMPMIEGASYWIGGGLLVTVFFLIVMFLQAKKRIRLYEERVLKDQKAE